MNSSKFTITIPVYNEAKTVYHQIQRIVQFIDSNKLNMKITVVNNGSTDNTKIQLDRLKSIPIVKVIDTPSKGVGIALRESWDRAQKNEIIGYMDLDLSTDIYNLNKIRDILDNYEVVTASRLENQSVVQNRKLSREIISRVFNHMIKLIFKSDINDHMCGFKFFRSDVYLNLQNKYNYSDDWFFLTEFLILAQKQNIPIYSLPVLWQDDPDSKVKVMPLTLSYLKSIFRLRRHVAT